MFLEDDVFEAFEKVRRKAYPMQLGMLGCCEPSECSGQSPDGCQGPPKIQGFFYLEKMSMNAIFRTFSTCYNYVYWDLSKYCN